MISILLDLRTIHHQMYSNDSKQFVYQLLSPNSIRIKSFGFYHLIIKLKNLNRIQLLLLFILAIQCFVRSCMHLVFLQVSKIQFVHQWLASYHCIYSYKMYLLQAFLVLWSNQANRMFHDMLHCFIYVCVVHVDKNVTLLVIHMILHRKWMSIPVELIWYPCFIWCLTFVNGKRFRSWWMKHNTNISDIKRFAWAPKSNALKTKETIEFFWLKFYMDHYLNEMLN